MSDPRTLVRHRQYIDLPGESPKEDIWPDVLNIIQLRKHRDVMIDIKLGNGATYAVVADKGRFYDPKRGLNVTRTTFKDGEPLHLWVGRYFFGNLIIKHGDKEIGRYPISKMDCTLGCRNDDPQAKPAPVMIILHEDKAFAQELMALEKVLVDSLVPPSASVRRAWARALAGSNELPASPFGVYRYDPATIDESQQAAARRLSALSSANADEDVLPMLHVFGGVTVDYWHTPEAIRKWVTDGNVSLRLDSSDIITRNWILGQMAGVGGYLHDALRGNGAWLREFWDRAFILQRTLAGKFVVMFSTSMKERRNLGFLLGAYRVNPHDTRVMTIAGGAGSLSASGKAAWNAAAGSIKGGGGLALAFTGVIDCVAWWDEYSQGKKDFVDLAVMVGLDLVKAGIGAALVSVIVSTTVTAFAIALGASAAYVIAIVLGTVAVTVIIGYATDRIFRELKIEDRLSSSVRKIAIEIEKLHPKDYFDLYSKSTWSFSTGVAF
jgi:hypothetical protein